MWRDWKAIKALARFFSGEKAEEPVVKEATGPADRKKGILKKIGLAFTGSSGSSGRVNFEGPAGFDFDEIERAYLTDSYIRQACDKYVDYMFKAGYDIAGKNTKAVEYIKLRLSTMAVATDKPLSEFLNEMAEDLVRYHNVFIIKARASNSYQYPPGITVKPVLSTKTVGGYFVLPVSTITIARDTNGTVKKYKQEIKGGGGNTKPIEINPEDMIHVSIDRPQGRAFGFPFLWQALDDVKLLRQVEELVDRMIYKNIFPTIIYQVGLDKEGFQSNETEIEEVKEQLAELPLDGGLVVPERHKVYAVGTGDKVIDASSYLEYFKKRVFTGLGVSSTIMGEADTSNRSTSDNLDQMFKDRIKAFQKIIEENFNSKIIYELLLEGGFDPLIKSEDEVRFKFKEIDLQAKMAEENHSVQLFMQNAITHEQLRLLLGHDPVSPEEENRLYFRMITIPTALETSVGNSDDQDAANNAGDNKNQPTNQHGTRTSAKTTRNAVESVPPHASLSGFSNAVLSSWESMKSDVSRITGQYVRKGKALESFEKKEIELAIRIGSDRLVSVANRYAGSAFINGVNDAQVESKGKKADVNMTYNLSVVNEEFKKVSGKLIEDLIEKIVNEVKTSTKETVMSKIVGAFDALQYRLKFMSVTQAYGAYNFGFAKAARSMGYAEAYIVYDGGCSICKEKKGLPVNLLSDQLPPFHPNCTCRLTLIGKGG